MFFTASSSGFIRTRDNNFVLNYVIQLIQCLFFSLKTTGRTFLKSYALYVYWF